MPARIPRKHGPPVGLIRWTGHCTNDVTYRDIFSASYTTTSLWVDNAHRRPLHWGGQDGMRLYNAPGDMPDVDTQAIVDADLLAANGACDFFVYSWYPPAECYTEGEAANISPQTWINAALDAHMVSPNKNLVDFMFMLHPIWLSVNASQPDWSAPTLGDYGKLASFGAWLADKMADSAYSTIQGRKVIGMYGYANLTAPQRTTFLAQLDLLLAMLPPVWIIVMDSSSAGGTDMLSRGARWKTTYGPNPSLPAYNANLPTTGALSHYPYSAQFGWNEGSWGGGGGIFVSPSITAVQDRRPMVGPNTAWCDLPTMPEWQALIGMAMRFSQAGVGLAELVMGYAWDEIGEGGPGIVPTVGEGTRFADALRWARQGKWPDLYRYNIDVSQYNAVKTGTWTEVTALAGRCKSNEMRSSTTDDRIDLTHERAQHLGWLCDKGPDRGIVAVSVDGGAETMVDLYSATPQVQQLVWRSPKLAGGTHSIRGRVTGTKHASSSSVSIGLDAVDVIYRP